MDANELAASIVHKIAGEPPIDAPTVMSVLGRAGGKKGGKRRLETMTPEQRREVALKAARARWEKAARKRR